MPGSPEAGLFESRHFVGLFDPPHGRALALGLAACQRGFPVGFTTAAALVHLLMEAKDERRLIKLQVQLQALKLLIIDELGYVPLSPAGAELLFDVFSQRYERGSIIDPETGEIRNG